MKPYPFQFAFFTAWAVFAPCDLKFVAFIHVVIHTLKHAYPSFITLLIIADQLGIGQLFIVDLLLSSQTED